MKKIEIWMRIKEFFAECKVVDSQKTYPSTVARGSCKVSGFTQLTAKGYRKYVYLVHVVQLYIEV